MSQLVTIHTGNVLQLSELRRRPGQTPADELYESLKAQLSDAAAPDAGSSKITGPAEASSRLVKEERDSQKVTVKLFLSQVCDENVTAALTAVFDELSTKWIDLLIIVWPSGIELENGKRLWALLEDLVAEGKVISLGVSDIDTHQFQLLYETVKIKPEVIQINLEHCCVVPPELAAFAKEKNLQLLTHNDPQDILSTEVLKTVLPSAVAVNWTARYQTLLRCRGIIHNKGYIISAMVI